MSGIFLSYRRGDSAGHAGRLYDRLSAHFGPQQVFRDLDSLSLGTEFTQTIREAVATCDSFVAVMGRDWTTVSRSGGGRRLDDPRDFVRLEIAAALERGIPVIPVLVEDAEMPDEEDLPVPLVRLSKYNGLALSDSRWNYDVDRLVTALERWTPPASKPPMSQPPAPPLTIQAPPVPDPPLAPYPPRSDRPAPDLRWLRFAVPAACVVAVVVVLGFVLGGGGSGGDGDGYVAQPTAIDVTVPSIVAWTETSLKLRSGDVVSVTATGQVSDDERKRPDRAFSPDGAPEPFSQNPGDVLLSANHGSLIGKIGGGTPFPLGKQATFTAGHAGTLFLGMNDGLFDDNGGSFQVHVSVHRP